MKKIITLLLLPLLAISFFSCKKDNEEENGNSTKLLKTVEWIVNEESLMYTFHYDVQNRPTKVYTTVNGCSYPEPSFVLEYSTNAITIFTGNDPNVQYQLDDNGHVAYCNYQTFIYENGYLKERIYNDSKVEYSWINGNIVQEGHITYEYSNKEDLLNIDVFNLFYEYDRWLKLKGHTSKNYLVKQSTGGGNYTYEYTFDTEGYPTKIIQSYNGQESGEIISTYY
jgi:hypothetical protein